MKRSVGHPPFVPTQEQRIVVRVMCACGMPQPIIARQTINPETGRGIDLKTLRKAFREELDDAKPVANAMVAQSLFKKATGSGAQSVAAAIFWLKTQAGWREPHSLDSFSADEAAIAAQSAIAQAMATASSDATNTTPVPASRAL